jgi:hypothetical protein
MVGIGILQAVRAAVRRATAPKRCQASRRRLRAMCLMKAA